MSNTLNHSQRYEVSVADNKLSLVDTFANAKVYTVDNFDDAQKAASESARLLNTYWKEIVALRKAAGQN